MSGSREKKTRLGQESGFTDPKTAREAAERKKQRRSDRMYAAIGIVFLLVAVFVVTWNSGVLRKASAVTIHGESYSAVETNYYFQNLYSSYANNQYASLLGLDPAKSLRSQPASTMLGAEEGQTWFDFILGQATDTMTDIAALMDAAEAEGFTVDDLDEQVQEQMDSLGESATSQGFTTGEYLKRVYGKGMTEKVFRELVANQIVATAYRNSYVDSLEGKFTDSDLDAAYAADPKSFDVVRYEQIFLSGTAASTTDADGNTVAPTEEENAAAMAESKTLADNLYAAYQDGQSLQELADGNDLAAYSSSADAGAGYASLSPTEAADWLFDDARQAGDSTVLSVDGTGTYILAFQERGRNDYQTVNVRHILIQPEATTLAEDDEGYQADVDEKKAQARQKAEDLLAQWQSGAATEDAFAELARENTADSNAEQGGLYERVYQGQMVPTFNDWCFDPARQTGDTGIVETDYGYHVMYFVGHDVPYWKVQVETQLKNQDFESWYDAKREGYEATAGGFGLRFVG